MGFAKSETVYPCPDCTHACPDCTHACPDCTHASSTCTPAVIDVALGETCTGTSARSRHVTQLPADIVAHCTSCVVTCAQHSMHGTSQTQRALTLLRHITTCIPGSHVHESVLTRALPRTEGWESVSLCAWASSMSIPVIVARTGVYSTRRMQYCSGQLAPPSRSLINTSFHVRIVGETSAPHDVSTRKPKTLRGSAPPFSIQPRSRLDWVACKSRYQLIAIGISKPDRLLVRIICKGLSEPPWCSQPRL